MDGGFNFFIANVYEGYFYLMSPTLYALQKRCLQCNQIPALPTSRTVLLKLYSYPKVPLNLFPATLIFQLQFGSVVSPRFAYASKCGILGLGKTDLLLLTDGNDGTCNAMTIVNRTLNICHGLLITMLLSQIKIV